MPKAWKTFTFWLVCTLKRSPRWYSLRRRVLRGANGCEACATMTGLQVHHVKPVYTHPELELDPQNLMVLCERCHLHIGHGGCWTRVNPMARDSAATLKANPLLKATVWSIARKVSIRMIHRAA